ncbi:uncharacterized protein DDB_G0284671-like [Penaeus japonicus]|uniref:uncharacterized protein DDB_G0284671-like n=1 Tax=Penaeus japonicus TaxID=27405 RepID=UPI001C712F11|nr:uncharacterized protein DDB_G0284671-like [Penaeus japonicus]
MPPPPPPPPAPCHSADGQSDIRTYGHAPLPFTIAESSPSAAPPPSEEPLVDPDTCVESLSAKVKRPRNEGIATSGVLILIDVSQPPASSWCSPSPPSPYRQKAMPSVGGDSVAALSYSCRCTCSAATVTAAAETARASVPDLCCASEPRNRTFPLWHSDKHGVLNQAQESSGCKQGGATSGVFRHGEIDPKNGFRGGHLPSPGERRWAAGTRGGGGGSDSGSGGSGGGGGGNIDTAQSSPSPARSSRDVITRKSQCVLRSRLNTFLALGVLTLYPWYCRGLVADTIHGGGGESSEQKIKCGSVASTSGSSVDPDVQGAVEKLRLM